MYLQGNLQAYFDALYAVGAIQRVMTADWNQIVQFRQKHWQVYRSLVEQLSRVEATQLPQLLRHISEEYQNSLALEVAHEFAEYSQRTQLH